MFTKSHMLRKGTSGKTLCGIKVNDRPYKGFRNGTCQNCLDIVSGHYRERISYWKRMRLG